MNTGKPHNAHLRMCRLNILSVLGPSPSSLWLPLISSVPWGAHSLSPGPLPPEFWLCLVHRGTKELRHGGEKGQCRSFPALSKLIPLWQSLFLSNTIAEAMWPLCPAPDLLNSSIITLSLDPSGPGVATMPPLGTPHNLLALLALPSPLMSTILSWIPLNPVE